MILQMKWYVACDRKGRRAENAFEYKVSKYYLLTESDYREISDQGLNVLTER